MWSRESINKILQLIDEFSKTAQYEANIEKSTAFEKFKGTRISKTLLMIKLGRPDLLNTMSYYTATVVKAQRYTNQWTPAAQKQMIIYKDILFMTKMEMQSSGKRITSLINLSRPIWYRIMGKKQNRIPASHYTQN